MTPDQLTYLVFGILLIVALAFDLGLLSKKHAHVTIKKALWQTIFWVSLAIGFFIFVWIKYGQVKNEGRQDNYAENNVGDLIRIHL